MLVFVVPLLHPAAAHDWRAVQDRLRDTARSLCSQRGERWRAILIANDEAALPELPPRLEVIRVQEPPPNAVIYTRRTPDENQRRIAVRRDKGRKMLAGLLHARSSADLGSGASSRSGGSAHAMFADADDLVSNRLAEFVEEHAGEPGWFVRRGYVHQCGRRWMYLHPNFHEFCGTCHLVRMDLLRLPPALSAAPDEYVQRMIGSHKYRPELLADAGVRLSPLPFPGAVYRVGHAQNVSGTPGLRRVFFSRGALRNNPIELVRRLGRLRPVTAAVRSEMLAGCAM